MDTFARPTGRPDQGETVLRTQQFVRLILDGRAFDQAAREARVKPIRALAILSSPEIRQVMAASMVEAA